MTDDRDLRRSAAPDPLDTADAARTDPAPEPDDALHGIMGVEMAAVGGTAAGFPAASITNPDLLGRDDPAEGPRDDAYDGGGEADPGTVPGEGTTQRR
jgi:hypothetical protein